MTAELSKTADEVLRARTGMPGTSGVISRDLVRYVVGAPDLAAAVMDEWIRADLARDHDHDHDHVELTTIMQPATGSFPAYRASIEWYRIRVTMADKATQPHSWRLSPIYELPVQVYESAEHATSWFKEHRHRLMAMLEAAVSHAWYDLAWQLAEPLWSLSRLTGDHINELATQALSLTVVEHLAEDEQARHGAVFHGRAAYALSSLQRHNDALQEAEQALEDAHRADDPRILSIALSIHGRALHFAGQPRAGLESYQRALTLAEQIEDPRSIALRHRRIGEALIELNDLTSALSHLTTAADLMTIAGDAVGHARVLTFLGRALLEDGQPGPAHDMVYPTLPILASSGCGFWSAEANEILGRAAEHNTTSGVDALLYYAAAFAKFVNSGESRRIEQVLKRITKVLAKQAQ